MLENSNLLIIKKFSGRNFRENKLRNFVLILTVIITTAMILTMNIMITNMVNSMERTYQKQAGTNAHVLFTNINADDVKKINNFNEVAESGNNILLGNVIDNDGVDMDLEIRSLDTTYAMHTFTEPDQGTAPTNDNEIVLSMSVLKRLGISPSLGEYITLNWKSALGNDKIEEKEFCLVGYWFEGSEAEEGYAWVSNTEVVDVKDAAIETSVMFKKSSDIESMTQQIADNLELSSEQYEVNWAYDSNTLKTVQMETLLYRIAILLIFVSGILLLFNIMQISVKLDIKLYGRMRTLGSSARQIRGVVYSQMLIIGLIGIPLGLLLGERLGRFIVSGELAVYFAETEIKLQIADFVSTIGIMAAAIFISGILPARTASKVSPTELLREDNSFGFTRKNERNSPGLPMLFQLSLANIGRNKVRSAISIGFMALGLVMLSCVYVVKESFDIEKYMAELSISDYSISDKALADEKSVYESNEMNVPDSLIDEIEKIDGITENGRLLSKEVKMKLSDNVIEHITSYYEANNGEIIDYMAFDVNWSKGYQSAVESKEYTATIFGIDGLAVESIVQGERLLQGSYDSSKFFSGNYAIAQGIYDPSVNSTEQPTYQVGDVLSIDGKEFEIMAVVEAPAPIMEGKGSDAAAFTLSFFIPSTTFQDIYPESGIRKIYFNVNAIGRVNVESYLENQDNKQLAITSENILKENYEKETKAMLAVQILVSSMVFGIGLLNMINSMITATTVRRKEFAIMQSLGMTKKQLRALLFFEGMSHAIITLLLAYFFSLLIISTIIKAYLVGQWSATYQLTITPLLICTPIIIGVSLAVPMLCFNQIAKESPVNRLKRL